MRHQSASIGKMHVSVQEMLAEARELINPTHKRESMLTSSNSHLQIHLSSSRINNRLRQILHLPEQSYKKIERQRRKSLVKLHASEKDQEASGKKVNETYNSIPPILLTKLADRYHMKTIINNFESELVDQKFHHNMRKQSRPLCNKNAISLLPEVTELPTLKAKSNTMHQQKQASVDHSAKGNPKIYLTITQQDLIKARQRHKAKQHKTIAQKPPKMLKQLYQQPSSRPKQNKSSKVQQNSINPQAIRNNAVNKNLKSSQTKIPEQQKYEPWSLEAQDPQLGDIPY